jgi:protein-disulfide isomerase
MDTISEPQLTKKEKRLLKKQEKLEAIKKVQSGTLMKKFLSWGIGIALVALGFWYVKGLAVTQTTTLPVAGTTETVEHDHSMGATDSAKLLVEYSDLQCPACAAYHPLVKQVMENFGSQIRLVYRQFPLRSIHKNAQIAGQALEAAGLQGKYWEMQDILFTRQKDWDTKSNAQEIFVTYAEELKIDIEKFKTDSDSEEVKNKINADYQSGERANINSTPTFFLNGVKLEPATSYDDFVSKLGLSK